MENIDYRAALYARFPHDDHEIREGGKNYAKTKIQWFVYLGREAIQARLDELFFMRWTLIYHTPILQPKFYAITACIAIDGVSKEYGGGQRVKGDEMTEDTIKGAYTDAFRRAASMWGVGLYLQNTPPLWTAAYEAKDWDAKRARENEAYAQFSAWLTGMPQNAPKQAQAGQALPTPQGTENAASRSLVWAKENNYDISKNPTPNNVNDNRAWDKWRQDVLTKNRIVS